MCIASDGNVSQMSFVRNITDGYTCYFADILNSGELFCIMTQKRNDRDFQIGSAALLPNVYRITLQCK